MVESDKYKLSTYQTIEKIRETDTSVVEVVECSLDGKKYIKKTYHSDKRSVFQTLTQINCVHIPHIYEVFFTDDTIVIEEFIEGNTLEQLISEKHIFTKKDIDLIANGLLDAISALHGNDLIHRDIKPGNIIIMPDGQAVLIDYSITRPYSADRNKDTELFGTIGYAAPEQFGFSQSDYRTDIYAFGVTMKLILTKRNVSQHLYNAVIRCTEFDPLRRFQSVDELRNYIKHKKQRKSIGVFVGCMLVVCAIVVFLIVVLRPDQIGSSNTSIPDTPATTEPHNTSNIPESDTNDTPNVQSTTDVSGGNEPNDNTPSETQGDLIFTAGDNRIIDIRDAGEDIPCLSMWEDGTYEAVVPLGNNFSVEILAVKNGRSISLTINNENVFSFEDDGSISTASYPDGAIYAEIVFYDLNKDGVLDIIPTVCDAVKTEWWDGSISLLKNYSLAWCIYYDVDMGYESADGKMLTTLDPFKIYASMPGCLQADFPTYYTLADGVLILK